MAAGFACGAAEGGDAELADAAGLAAFSAGFASSSAMMRRIDARISSIEGSWTFAGCVMSDSTSSTPWPSVLHQAGQDWPVPDLQAPTCPQIKRLSIDSRRPASPKAPKTSRLSDTARIALVPCRQGMSWQQLIASNGRRKRFQIAAGSTGQRPSGMRTPTQLSRT
jgi:hypothetical protein